MKVDETNKTQTFLIFRFGKKKWIDQFKNGTFSFSCAGAYIEQGKTNQAQGDLYEAVFARLKKSDPRIEKMKRKLGEDLEIIEDLEYVMLRRKSAKLIPIFCFFHYEIQNLREGSLGEVGEDNLVPISLEFDKRMFTGFSEEGNVAEEDRLETICVYTEPFIKHVKRIVKSPFGSVKNAEMHRVDYSKRKSEEFFIEPTEEYTELFCKDESYAYQHEGRIALLNMRFDSTVERIDIETEPFKNTEYNVTDVSPFKIVLVAHVSQNGAFE